jgi:hypothetical protein
LETFFLSDSFVHEGDDKQKKNRAKEDETKENMSKQEAADESRKVGGLFGRECNCVCVRVVRYT